jgi:hypothetical protein
MITSTPKLPETLYLQSSGVFQCLCGRVFVWWVMCVASRDPLELVADMYILRHNADTMLLRLFQTQYSSGSHISFITHNLDLGDK